MLSNLIVAFAAGLLAGSPSIAQDADLLQITPEATAPSDAEINEAAEAFRARVETMNAEVRAAVEAAGPNRRRALARVETILARHQPEIDSFATQLEAWFSVRARAAPTHEAQDEVFETGAASVARVRGVPDQIRAGLTQRAQAQARTDRPMPEQPRNTQPSYGY
jgi:hypothetical protein